MKSSITAMLAACAASALLAAAPVDAATLSALATFGGGDGYLAPGDRPYLPAAPGDNAQRGLAWNPVTNNLLLANRTGGNSINVIDGLTGADEGVLAGIGIAAGGIFPVNMVAAADDGAIYMVNLTTDSANPANPFKIYRWANEADAAPTVAYSGIPHSQTPAATTIGVRIGDNLDVRGSGASTRLVAGYGSTATITGDNSFALFTTADGAAFTSTHIAVGTNPPADGDFRLGITFVDDDTVIGKQTTNGRVVDITGPGAGTLNSSFALDATSINPMDYAVVGGVPFLAAVNTSSTGESKVFVYRMTNPTTPVLVASGDNLPGASNANANGVGQVRFGAITPTTATIYVLNVNNGIQAFQLTNVPEPASAGMLGVGLAIAALARRRRSAA